MHTVDYNVGLVDADDICPSPENDDIYGAQVLDTQMNALIESIEARGLSEPLILSGDYFIISGHRRFFACKYLGWDQIPVRIDCNVWHSDMSEEEWREILVSHNPQRSKSPLILLKEALAKTHSDDPDTYRKKWEDSDATSGDPEYSEVRGTKPIGTISSQRMPFLEKVQEVVQDLEDYWPLTVRSIHYQLLNHEVYVRTSAQGTDEKNLYRNDAKSYKALIKLASDARYAGLLNPRAIDDPTRPQFHFRGFDSLESFTERQMEDFLTGYHRWKQLEQPAHIVVIGEKGTLTSTLKPVSEEYQVPLYLSRGYGSYPMWADIARSFASVKKKRLVLLSITDFDPEGLDLPKDGVRALRDHFGVPVDFHRVAVTESQIKELNLIADYNPAKKTSTRYESFVKETGGTKSWECEALPPAYLRDQLRNAIESNMNMDAYRAAEDQEQKDLQELAELRDSFFDGNW